MNFLELWWSFCWHHLDQLSAYCSLPLFFCFKYIGYKVTHYKWKIRKNRGKLSKKDIHDAGECLSDDYYDKYLLFQDYFFAVDDVNSLFWSRNALSLKIEDYFLGLDVTGNLANAVGYAWYSCSWYLLGCLIEGESEFPDAVPFIGQVIAGIRFIPMRTEDCARTCCCSDILCLQS